MDVDHGSPERILRTLRFRPRGMTITEIAKHTGLTRNSVSKHLEVLRMGGLVDMCTVGNAKVYSLAQRVPISAFLCFTNNLIVVLDRCGNILQINERFLSLAGLKKDEVIGENIREVALPVVSTPETVATIEEVDREQFITDVRYCPEDCPGSEDFFYQMQVIPTVFGDGERGRTIVLEDITEKKRYIRTMEFLAATAMEFVDLPKETDIYHRIAEMLVEFIPEGQVFVQAFEEERNNFIIRAVMDADFRAALSSLLGRDPVGMAFPLDEVYLSPFLEDPKDIQRGIREIRVAPRSGEGSISFYDLSFRQIPEDVCEEIVTACNIGKAYLAFLVWKEHLLGDVGVFVGPEDEIADTHALESFIRLASIAISKRMTEDRLRRSNERFRKVIELFPFPTAIINAEERYTFINRKFTEVFGYTLADLRTTKDWFALAFPDEQVRGEAIAAWKNDLEQADVNTITPRMFAVRCRDGTVKAVLFRPILLCDKTHYITYEVITDPRQAGPLLRSGSDELQDVADDLRIRDLALASLTCAVAIADGSSRLRYVNPAFLSMWGYDSPDEVTGRNVSVFWAWRSAVLAGGQEEAVEEERSGAVTGVRRDRSTFMVQGRAGAISDESGRVMGQIVTFAERSDDLSWCWTE